MPQNAPTNTCPLCLKPYGGKRCPVTYHTSYYPEKTIIACNMCNYFEYLSRKHPEKVPRYGKKFLNRLKRIEALSPQYKYKIRQKFHVIKLDRFGNEIDRETEYQLVKVSEAKNPKKRTKRFIQKFNMARRKKVKLDLCPKCKMIMVMTPGLYSRPLMRCSNFPSCQFYKVVYV